MGRDAGRRLREGGRQRAPVPYPSLRVFDTGMGRKETLFSKNSALSQLDKHLKEKLHNWNWQSILILLSVCLFFSPHPSTCALQPTVTAPHSTAGLELCRLAPSSARPSLALCRAAGILPPPHVGGHRVFHQRCFSSPFHSPFKF